MKNEAEVLKTAMAALLCFVVVGLSGCSFSRTASIKVDADQYKHGITGTEVQGKVDLKIKTDFRFGRGCQ